jgi:glucose 1-dehydrogenase
MTTTERTVIVTGAAGGLGFGCAKRFADDGAQVALVDINRERGEQMTEALLQAGRKVAFFQCDVGIKGQVDATVAAVVERYGDIQAIVANAGINRPANFLELTEEAFDLVIQTNLKSVFLFGQAVARHMVERGIPGSIINMGSTSAVMTMPTLAAYAASKGGISALTNAMALSLAPHKIRVNAIGPGTILTDMTRARLWDDEKQRAAILARTPMGRYGEPSDVAGLGLNYTMPTPG